MPTETMQRIEELNQTNNSQEVVRESFDSEKSSKELATLQQDAINTKEQQLEEANWLKQRLSVESFISKECVEPIDGVNKIVPFEVLVDLIVKSAKEEFDRVKSLGYDNGSEEEKEKYKNVEEVRNKVKLFTSPHENLTDDDKKQIEGLAKDQRIYELPAYKNLIESGGFIIPSDIRTSYDSAEQKPVKHLGVDYNVKAGTPVKSIYDGEVVESGFDGGLGNKVIIEHEMKDGSGKITKFYSLYGHLGSTNLPRKGDNITKGAPIGIVGAPFSKENGNWEEHLHFQIMEKQDSPEGYSKDTQKEQIGNYDVLSAFGKEYKEE